MAGKASLLIVEDDSAVQALLQDLLGLKGEGYKVSVASCLKEALRELSQKDFQLVTLDGEFPGGGGSRLAEILRTQYPTTKVLSIAGEKQSYGDENLQKPLDISTILKVVENLLSS